ncbi:OmpH family outer membrane protein [Candidatus Williamhamiltonella defendens]|uniref:OmpH family outer membrane protein n=1 Tax=Candidatus Williamhamiltonella defendens TaxID=138072 RepID=UPI00130D653D|nr:OmpH family outer membrane protein [Candidatus Hamiltonella defensa]
MKKFLVILSIFLGLSLRLPAQAASNIAVIDIQTIVQNSPEKKEADKNFESKFKERETKLKIEKVDLEDKIKNFEKNFSTIKQMERKKFQKEIDNKRDIFIKNMKAFQNDTYKFQAEESAKIFRNIKSIVKSVAYKKGYETVIDFNTVIYNKNDKSDITNDVLREMLKKATK